MDHFKIKRSLKALFMDLVPLFQLFKCSQQQKVKNYLAFVIQRNPKISADDILCFK
jgi:hypothetical protein